MKIRTAICDDDKLIGVQTKCILKDIYAIRGIEGDIDVFSSGEELCKKLKRGRFDLIFLDIELPQRNGVEVGRYIREELDDEEVEIAFISAKNEYAMDLFKLMPINFLIKPLDQDKLEEVVDKYVKITKKGDRFFEYKKNKDYISVPMSDIYYFESKSRKIIIHMKNGADEFYGSVESVYASVKESDFIHIHKSYVVNYRYIKVFSHDRVEMIQNEVLPISASRRTEARKRFLEIKKGGR